MAQVKDKIYDDIVNALDDQSGKVVAVTGCTSGTGFFMAKAAILKNVTLLILLNRSSSRSEKCEESLKAIAKETGSETKVQTIACDLMNLDSVREAALNTLEAVKSYGGLDVLVNNAGVMAFPDNRTKDGFDVQMQTNHISHFLLTKLLMPALEEAMNSRGEARVVQHSSGARNMGGKPLAAKYFEKSEKGTLGGDASAACVERYHQTKLANTVFAMALHKRFQEKGLGGIKSLVAEPGVAATALMTNLGSSHAEGAEGFSFGKLYNYVEPIFGFVAGFFLQSAGDGACPLIEASFAKDANSGDFYIPKFHRYGVPVKRIAGGKSVKPGRENLTLSEESQDLLWEKSEEAIGEPFF